MSILTVSFVLISWIFGLTIMDLFKIKFNGFTDKLMAGLIGMVSLSEVIFYQSWLLGFSKVNILTTMGLIGLASIWWQRKKIKGIKRQIFKDWLKFLGAGLIILSLWGLIWSKVLVSEADGWYSNCPNCFGDWAAHLSYTTSFAYGDNWPPQLPILAGKKFSYPFMADFMSAMLLKLDSNLITSLTGPGLLWAGLLTGCLVSFGKELGGKTRVGILTAWLWLLNGGLGWWWLGKDIQKQGFQEVLANIPRDYTHLGSQANIVWINVISSQIIPQRGFLMAMPIAITIYLLWHKGLKSKKNGYMVIAGWLTVCLALVQAHSMMVVMMLAGMLTLISRDLKKWRWFWIIILLGGGAQVVYFYGDLGERNFFRWHLGWMAGQDNWLWFWLKNTGVALLLSLWGWLKANKQLRRFTLGFWLIFILSNLFLFQPYDWDNTKLLIHWYLMAAVMMAMVLDKWLEGKKTAVKLTGVLLLISLSLAGGFDSVKLIQYQQHKYRFFSNEDLNMAAEIRNESNQKAVFLTASNHNHWLPCLTGRKIIMGYKGWLWTYGLDYRQREQDVRLIYAGAAETKELVKKYNINYIVIGPNEREEFKEINEKYFEDNYTVLKENKNTKIYTI